MKKHRIYIAAFGIILFLGIAIATQKLLVPDVAPIPSQERSSGEEQEYTDKTLGFSISKPSGVYFIDEEGGRVSFSLLSPGDIRQASSIGLMSSLQITSSQTALEGGKEVKINGYDASASSTIGGYAGEEHRMYFFPDRGIFIHYVATPTTEPIYEGMIATIRFGDPSDVEVFINVDQNSPGAAEKLFNRLVELGADRQSLRYVSTSTSHYVRDARSVYWTFVNPRKVEGADADSFSVMSGGGGIIGHDRKYVFITGDMVPKADPGTFSSIDAQHGGGSYYRDHAAVFYQRRVDTQGDYRYRLDIVAGADPKTIRLMPLQTGLLAADDVHVYMDGYLVPYIDGETFSTEVSSPYVHDAHGTYFHSGFSEGKGPSLLRLSSSSVVKVFTDDYMLGGYVSIGSAMFFGTTTIDGADPATFQIFDAEQRQGGELRSECVSTDRCLYAKDARSVYHSGMRIAGADPASFAPIGYGLLQGLGKDPGNAQPAYASDVARVYYRGRVVEGADPRTFTPSISGGYAYEYGKDAHAVYWQDKRIEYADPATFKPLEGQQPYEGCSAGRYGIDATGAYYQDKRIEGADIKTFKVIIGEGKYAEDALRFYVGDQPAERSAFKVCNYG